MIEESFVKDSIDSPTMESLKATSKIVCKTSEVCI